jgi:HEAT repeat protein
MAVVVLLVAGVGALVAAMYTAARLSPQRECAAGERIQPWVKRLACLLLLILCSQTYALPGTLLVALAGIMAYLWGSPWLGAPRKSRFVPIGSMLACVLVLEAVIARLGEPLGFSVPDRVIASFSGSARPLPALLAEFRSVGQSTDSALSDAMALLQGSHGNAGRSPNWRLSAALKQASLDELGLLKAVIRDRTNRARIHAVHLLGDLEGGVPELVGLLEDPREAIRFAAIAALGESGQREAIRPLLRLLRTGKSPIRLFAIEALRRLAEARRVQGRPGSRYADRPRWDPDVSIAFARVAAGELSACFEDREPEIRAAAANSLGTLASPGSAAALLKHTDDPSSEVAAASIRALGEITDPAAADQEGRSSSRAAAREIRGRIVSQLLKALKHPVLEVRLAAADTLRRYVAEPTRFRPTPTQTANTAAGPGSVSRPDGMVMGALTHALQDPASEVSWAAAEVLIRLGEPGWHVLVSTFPGGNEATRQGIVGAVAHSVPLSGSIPREGFVILAAALRDTSATVRSIAETGFSPLRGNAEVDRISEAGTGGLLPDPRARARFVEALERRAWPKGGRAP